MTSSDDSRTSSLDFPHDLLADAKKHLRRSPVVTLVFVLLSCTGGYVLWRGRGSRDLSQEDLLQLPPTEVVLSRHCEKALLSIRVLLENAPREDRAGVIARSSLDHIRLELTR